MFKKSENIAKAKKINKKKTYKKCAEKRNF